MATIKFITGKPNSQRQSIVFLQYGHAQKRVIFSTGLKIDANQDWDRRSGKVKRNHPNSSEFNDALRKAEALINSLVLQALANSKEPTVSLIRNEYRLSKTKNISFFEAFISFINDSKHTKADSTLKIYQTLITRLNEFEKQMNFTITWDAIDGLFLERFTNYQIKCELLNSTIKRNNSFLLAFLNHSATRGLVELKNLKVVKVRVPKKEAISLTEEELRRIKAVDLPDSLKKIRDVFYFTCIAGGIRFSDIASIKREMVSTINGRQVLQLLTQKTRTYTRIPLIKEAVRILESYNYSLRTVSHQRYLKLIKRVAKLAGVNKPTLLVSLSGTTKNEKIVEKHSIIGAHTARRTYITLSLNKGVPIQMIASITHNNNVSSLLKYISVDEERKIEIINKAWE